VAEYLKRPKPASETDDRNVQDAATEILRAVREEGIDGIRQYSRKLDSWDPGHFRVSEAEIERACASVDPYLRTQIDFAIEQISGFAKLQKASLTDFEAETQPGVWLGQKHIPIGSVGAYSPGGRYPLIASSIMTIAVPKVAGVGRIVAAAPPSSEGGIHPPQIYAMHKAGADEILCLGGVQALGAMAYGFDECDAVDFIVGAGNQYVTEAKRQLFGTVGIDLLAGPSEVLVIADETANPELVAIDLLGQAEHGVNSPCWFATTSHRFAVAVLAEIDRWLGGWPTAEVAAQSWRDCGIAVVCEDDEELALVADELAPEHVEVHTEDPQWYLNRLRNYGSLFLTPYTTVAYGDKAIGTNHVLPTLKAARYTGGLWVGKFMKTVTYQRANAEGSRLIAPVVDAVASAERMLGHAVTAKYRLDPDETRRTVLGAGAADHSSLTSAGG
jgi:sulfopropanediol 3-dehydrogenase